MNDDQLKKQILTAANNDIPNLLNTIKSHPRFVIPASERWLWLKRKPLQLASVFVILFALGLVLFNAFLVSEPVYSTVYIEINPSFEIDINKDMEVIALRGINNDATAIITALIDTKGITLEQLLDLILDESIARGFLTSSNPYVMFDVRANTLDVEISALQHLQQSFVTLMDNKPTLIEAVRGNLGNLPDNEIEQARALNIGEQKWVLIQQVIRINDEYDVDDLEALAQKSISELRNLRKSPTVQIPNNNFQ